MRRPWKPSDNTALGEKVELRRRLLHAIPSPRVLDCYAGSGHLWRDCYRGLPYLGLDRKPVSDGRPLLRTDNRMFLRRADLTPYNFFDLDAWGSPWHPFLIVLHRRPPAPGERLAFAITDGLQFKLRMSDCPSGLRPYLGLPAGMRVPCLGRHQEFLAALVVSRAARDAGARIEKAWIAGNPRKSVLYLGLILEGTAKNIN